MREQLEQTLIEVTEMTCETLAFLFPMPPPEDGVNLDDERYEERVGARVRFDGLFEGSLTVTVPREMLPALAANMLGLTPDGTTPDQRMDAVRELSNVVCGNLLPAIAGTEPVFSVSPPELCEDPTSAHSPHRVRARSWLDEGWVEVTFTVDEGFEVIEGTLADPDVAGEARSAR
jgi:chemotaxis protein CheY-P-specific phosphatase CheC